MYDYLTSNGIVPVARSARTATASRPLVTENPRPCRTAEQDQPPHRKLNGQNWSDASSATSEARPSAGLRCCQDARNGPCLSACACAPPRANFITDDRTPYRAIRHLLITPSASRMRGRFPAAALRRRSRRATRFPWHRWRRRLVPTHHADGRDRHGPVAGLRRQPSRSTRSCCGCAAGCGNIANTDAAERPAALVQRPDGHRAADAVGPAPWRFNMTQNGKRMTADEFDAWMRGAACAWSDASPIPLPATAPTRPQPSRRRAS